MKLKDLRRMSPPAYDPIRFAEKKKPILRISHTVPVEGHGTIENLAAAHLAWRTRRTEHEDRREGKEGGM